MNIPFEKSIPGLISAVLHDEEERLDKRYQFKRAAGYATQ